MMFIGKNLIGLICGIGIKKPNVSIAISTNHHDQFIAFDVYGAFAPVHPNFDFE